MCLCDFFACTLVFSHTILFVCTLFAACVSLRKERPGALPEAKATYLQGTVLVSGDLVIPVAVPVQGREHDAEGPRPLAKQDEKMVPQALLGEEKSPVVN